MIAVVGQRAALIRVQQLNHAQWHAIDGDGRWCSGVVNWPGAVSAALCEALLTNRGVESVDLNGGRLVLVRPETGA